MTIDDQAARALAAQFEAAADDLQALVLRLEKLVQHQAQTGTLFDEDWPAEYRIRYADVDRPLEAGGKLFQQHVAFYPALQGSWRDGGSYWGKDERTSRPVLEECRDKAGILRRCAGAVRAAAEDVSPSR